MAMTLRIPEDLDLRVKARARRENLSANKIIERIVAAHVDDDLENMTERQKRIAIGAAAHAVRDEDVLERLA